LDLPDMAYVEAGIFSGASLKRCVMRKVQRATHAGMVGKLSKMAMGYFVTHVAGNRVDTGFLASLAAECGASAAVQDEIRQASSARHFQEIALSHGLTEVFTLMCRMVCDESRNLLQDDADDLVIDTLCFDFDGALLGSASTSPDGIQFTVSPGNALHD
jgi:cobalt-precorrin-5B (C1)-methyltransferase